MRILTLFVFSFLTIATAQAALVEFSIAPGTDRGPWNSPDTMIEVMVGDTLRIYNDDSVRHRLHTFGAPCSHGPNIAPGEYWDCFIRRPYDSMVSGPVYDHYYGPDAEVWIRALSELGD